MKELSKESKNKKLTISEAAIAFGKRSRQSIFWAIKNGRIKAERIAGCWYITEAALIEYQETKYSREVSMFEGKPLYDMEAGEFSPTQMAKLLGIKLQLVYYLIYNGSFKSTKKGGVHVLNKDQAIEAYTEWKKGYRHSQPWDNGQQMEFAMGDK